MPLGSEREAVALYGSHYPRIEFEGHPVDAHKFSISVGFLELYILIQVLVYKSKL